MDHDRILIYGRFYLIKSEILREDNRPRKGSIVTFLDEHAFCIEIDRCMDAFTGESEYIAREGDIYLTRIDSGNRSYDDDLLSEIEDIDGDLSDIDLMLTRFTTIHDHLMDFMIDASSFLTMAFR
jgi:hypothetical protein